MSLSIVFGEIQIVTEQYDDVSFNILANAIVKPMSVEPVYPDPQWFYSPTLKVTCAYAVRQIEGSSLHSFIPCDDEVLPYPRCFLITPELVEWLHNVCRSHKVEPIPAATHKDLQEHDGDFVAWLAYHAKQTLQNCNLPGVYFS